MPVSRETQSALERLSPDQQSGMLTLAQWLCETAFPLGLTNYHDADTMLSEAVLPAAALPDVLGQPLSGAWIDIGAGSGAIGLALAILAPAAAITLGDRRRRAVSFLDLTAKRLSLANVTVLEAGFTREPTVPAYTGVCFRALAAPAEALAIAAAHAQRWVCAWHSPAVSAYDAPPDGFSRLSRIGTCTPALVVDLYERDM